MAQYGGEAGVKARRLAVLESQRRAENEPCCNLVGQPVQEGNRGPETGRSESDESTGDDADPPVCASEERRSIVIRTQPADRASGVSVVVFRWGVLLLRLLLDPTMVRRPLAGTESDQRRIDIHRRVLVRLLDGECLGQRAPGVGALDQIALERLADPEVRVQDSGGSIRRGPGYALLNLIPSIPANPLVPEGAEAPMPGSVWWSRR
jgi:hypothetical protein